MIWLTASFIIALIFFIWILVDEKDVFMSLIGFFMVFIIVGAILILPCGLIQSFRGLSRDNIIETVPLSSYRLLLTTDNWNIREYNGKWFVRNQEGMDFQIGKEYQITTEIPRIEYVKQIYSPAKDNLWLFWSFWGERTSWFTETRLYLPEKFEVINYEASAEE